MRNPAMNDQLPRQVYADGQFVTLLERAESGVVYADEERMLSVGMFVAVDSYGELILVATGIIYLNAHDRVFQRRNHAKRTRR